MSSLARDSNGQIIQAINPHTIQNVSVAAASAACSNAVGGNTTMVMLISTTNCWFKKAASPTAAKDATSVYLPAGVYYYLPVKGGSDKVAFIRDSADGTAQVIEAG